MEDVLQGKAAEAAGGTAEPVIKAVEENTKMKDPVLDRISRPADLRDLTTEELRQLCGEIREFIIDVVSRGGGHLGASLGVVELTVAMHRAAPADA